MAQDNYAHSGILITGLGPGANHWECHGCGTDEVRQVIPDTEDMTRTDTLLIESRRHVSSDGRKLLMRLCRSCALRLGAALLAECL